MGLFDRFRKRVNEVVEETDTEAISAEENTSEAIEALDAISQHEEFSKISTHVPAYNTQSDFEGDDDDWEDLEEEEELELPSNNDDEWDDWDITNLEKRSNEIVEWALQRWKY